MIRLLTSLSALALALLSFSCSEETPIVKATEEKIMIIGNSNEPAALDPQVVTGVLENNIIRALFEGHCVEDPKSDSDSQPGVAESWEANEDYTRWTFHLRKDAKWSDGKALTSEDFRFAHERILRPNFGAKYATMLYFLKNAKEYNENQLGYILCGLDENFPTSWNELKQINFRGDKNISVDSSANTGFASLSQADQQNWIAHHGLDNLKVEALQAIQKSPELVSWPEAIPAETRLLVIQRLLDHRLAGSPDLWNRAQVGVQTPDEHTVVYQLASTTPFLPHLTKHYTWFPVPKHTILAHGEIDQQHTRWTSPSSIVSNGPFKLTEWEFNHYIKTEKNPHYWDFDAVKLNGIEFHPITNPYTEARMFYNDQLHMTYTLPPEMIDYSREKYPDSLRQEPYLGVNFMRCNVTRNALKDKRVRQALAMSIDQQAIIEHLLKGGQLPATGLTPPLSGYPTLDVVKFNPDKARELMTAAGYENPRDFPTINILTTDRDTSKRLSEAFQDMWKKHLGIDVTIAQREWKTYLDRVNRLDYDLVVGGWIGDYPDPTTFLDLWKKSNGNNNTGWSSKEYEELLKQASISETPEKRFQLLAEAEAVLLEEMPVLPTYWYTTNYLLHPSVKGWHPLLQNSHPYKFVDLETN